MGVKLKNQKSNYIAPARVGDGEICIIRHSLHPKNIGRIIQRVGDSFFTLGEGKDSVFSSLYSVYDERSSLVEVLPKGTEIVI